MVAALRDAGAGAELAPPAGVADLERLVGAPGGRLRVDLGLDGELDGLPPAVDAAVYRIVQESVTNAMRHAVDATEVVVRVTGEPQTGPGDGAGRRRAGRPRPRRVRPGRAARAGGPARRGATRRPGRRPGLAGRGRAATREGRTAVTIRVLVADDQAIIRTGLRIMLDAQPDIEVVGEAADGREAVRLARELRPDVCLFDIRMPVLDGLEATRQLAGPGVADPMVVVVITTFDLDEYVYGALRAGARGFLLKDAGPELLVQAVRAAADGEALIAPSVTVRLLGAFADVPAGRPAAQPISPVTAREEEVLLAVARGLTNTEIADALHISLSTVKTHLASLMAKLGARNRVEIAMWAYETRRIIPGT